VLVLSEAVLVLVLDRDSPKRLSRFAPPKRPAKNGAPNLSIVPDFQTPNFVLVLVPAVIRASV
jgi:hypothetical protein